MRGVRGFGTIRTSAGTITVPADTRWIGGGMTRGGPEKRVRDVRVRLTEAEYQRWSEARMKSGRRELGAWVRAVVEEVLTRRRAGRRPGDLARMVIPEVNLDAAETLIGLANNINQLAKWANTERRAPEAERLRLVAARVEVLLHEVRGSRPYPDGPAEQGDPDPVLVDEHDVDEGLVEGDASDTVVSGRRGGRWSWRGRQ